MITTLTTTETKQTIQGADSLLELVLGEPVGQPRSAWGIVCHPHPLYGGTMDNKVVTTIIKAFQNLGCNTVRFNFRGVGKSEGKFDNGVGELEDLLAVINWVQQQKSQKELWLGGFSFGAGIAARAATQIPVDRLVTVAPAVEHTNLYDLPPIKCKWILVQGEKDDVVAPQTVFDWAATRNPPPELIVFPEAGHFFHGVLTQLRTQLEEKLL